MGYRRGNVRGGYSTPGGYPWSRFALALLPTSIEHSNGVVTRWRDESGHARHAMPTGSPTFDDAGIAPAVVLNGGTARLDGSLVGLDTPATIFVLFTPTNANAGGATWILDTQAAAAGDSWAIAQYYTSLIAFKTSFSQGAAYAYNSTSPVLIRADCTRESTALRLDGVWRGSGGMGSTPHTAAGAGAYRIGKALDGSAGATGKCHGVWILHGTYTDEELDRVEREILDLAGKTHPFAWPPQANALGGDPGLILPATIDAIAGRAPGLEFWKASLADRDGSSSLAFSSSLPRKAWAHDRWTVLPMTPGASDTITISEGAYSATATINCVPMIAPGEDPMIVECWGNSQVAHWRLGMQEAMVGEVGNLIQFVGSAGPEVGGYTTKNTGYDSTQASDFATGSSAYIPGGVSPFWHSGAVDMAYHFAQLDAVPTHFFGEIVQNTAYTNSMAALPAAMTTQLAHVETIFASALAANPDLFIGIGTGCPFNLDPSNWGGHAGWLAFYEKALYARQRVIQQFDGRTAERIWVVDTFPRVDSVRGMRDSIHWNIAPGGKHLREVLLPWLVAHR